MVLLPSLQNSSQLLPQPPPPVLVPPCPRPLLVVRPSNLPPADQLGVKLALLPLPALGAGAGVPLHLDLPLTCKSSCLPSLGEQVKHWLAVGCLAD